MSTSFFFFVVVTNMQRAYKRWTAGRFVVILPAGGGRITMVSTTRERSKEIVQTPFEIVRNVVGRVLKTDMIEKEHAARAFTSFRLRIPEEHYQAREKYLKSGLGYPSVNRF
jgi:hypothetical protein